MPTYQWGKDTRLPGDAQAVGEAIEKLASRHGGVCPKEALVKAARSPRHPAHELFEWDDSIAAELHRNDQARRVMRSIKVVVNEQEAPAFVRVSYSDTRPHEGFMGVQKAMEIPDAKASVLRDAIAQLRGLQKRYSILSGTLQPVWDALDEVDPPR